MNKGGWLRIVEAAVSILIIFGALLIIFNTQIEISEKNLSDTLPSILDEISKNLTLREKIVSGNDTGIINEINLILSKRIKQPYLNYTVKICEPNEICSLEAYPENAQGDIFAAERIVSSTLTQYNPKKLKIFLWRIK